MVEVVVVVVVVIVGLETGGLGLGLGSCFMVEISSFIFVLVFWVGGCNLDGIDVRTGKVDVEATEATVAVEAAIGFELELGFELGL